MDSIDSQRKMIYAFIVIFMMMGVAVVGVTQVIMERADEDYAEPHSYSVTATMNDSHFSGNGSSEYFNESENTFVFHFVTVLEDLDVPSFNVICNKNRVPLESIYTLGEIESMGDIECYWWSYVVDEYTFSFAIDGNMIVHEYRIHGNGLSAVGIIE